MRRTRPYLRGTCVGGRPQGLSLCGLAIAALVLCCTLCCGNDSDAELTARLQALGIRVVQIERPDGSLRVTVENQSGLNEMVAAALVLKTAAALAPPDGLVEAIATTGGQTLFRVHTPAAKVDDFIRRSLSTRQQAQLRPLLSGPSSQAPPPPAPTPVTPIVINPTPLPPPEPGPQSSAEQIADALVRLGMENVQVGWQHNGDLNIRIENRTYRSDAAALGAVMETVGAMVEPRTLVRVAALRDERLLGVFTFRAGLATEFTTGESRGQLAEELEADRSTWDFKWPDAMREQTPVRNRSRDRIDLLLRPGLEYQIGGELDPLEATLLLRPELVSTIGKGLRASVRGRVPLESPFGFTLDRTLLTATDTDRQSLLWTASIGKFREDIYGGFLEAQWVDDSDRTRLGARLALMGTEPGEDEFKMAVGYAEREFGGLGLTARAMYGRFLQSADNDWFAELERRFGESTLRLGGTWGPDGNRLLAGLTFPFGGGKVTRPSALRVRNSPSVELDYASTILPLGDALFDAPDLRRFRGDLSLPYVRRHPEHLFGGVASSRRQERWVAPSFEGVTGLIRIPTADVIPDGYYAVGTSFIPKQQTSGLHAGASRSEPAYATVGFLPNLEFSFRLTFYPDVKPHFDGMDVDWPYDLDRSASAQYRLFRQSGWRPALAVGTQDIQVGDDSPKVGRTTYVVASGQYGPVGLHLGGGTGRFEAVFGGVELGLGDRVRLLGEYDAHDFNAGLRVHWPGGFTFDGAWLHGNDFGAAVSYQGRFP